MSVAIHTAYRVPLDRLHEFLRVTRFRTLLRFFRAVKRLAGRLAAEEGLRGAALIDALTARFVKAGSAGRRGHFAVDASLTVWVDGEFAYIIPAGRVVPCEAEWVKNFSLPSTDTGKGSATRPVWRERRETWARVALSDWNATRLVYQIVDIKGEPDANLTNRWEALVRELYPDTESAPGAEDGDNASGG